MAKRSQHNAWNEVYALILLGVGTLLFLALISYVPKDIPTWFPLLNSTSSPNRPAQNFLGPLGAIVAGLCYFLIGAASYLLAVTLLGFGGAKLFHGELKVRRRLGWILLFIASGACLFQLQPWFLHDWHRVFNIDGPGGRLGAFFGRRLFRVFLGKGSVIVLFGIYLTSLILMTGLRPIHLVRQSVLATRRGFVALRLWLLHRRMRKTDLKGQLEISQQEIAKQQRALEKKLRKKGAPVPKSRSGPRSPARGIRQSPRAQGGRYDRAPVRRPGAEEAVAGRFEAREKESPGSGAWPNDRRLGRGELQAARTRSARGTRQRRPRRDRSGGAGGDPADADRDVRPVRHPGGAGRHHERPDHYPLRSLSRERGAGG